MPAAREEEGGGSLCFANPQPVFCNLVYSKVFLDNMQSQSLQQGMSRGGLRWQPQSCLSGKLQTLHTGLQCFPSRSLP